MIDSAVYRMMRATRIEQQAWSEISDGVGGWIVHDIRRLRTELPLSKGPIRNNLVYEKHHFAQRSAAQDYITFRIHKAGLIAALRFWRRP